MHSLYAEMCEDMRIFAYAAQFPRMQFWKRNYMWKNMQCADFATYAIACAIVGLCSHITGITITAQVYSVHCWPRKYSMSRFYSADTLRPYSVWGTATAWPVWSHTAALHSMIQLIRHVHSSYTTDCVTTHHSVTPGLFNNRYNITCLLHSDI